MAIVPYFEIDSHPDGVDAVMVIDQELAKENPIFGRTFFACEVSPNMIAGKRDRGVNLTVVKEIRPGIRIRRWLRVEWNSTSREGVFIPDDLFDDLPRRIQEIIDED